MKINIFDVDRFIKVNDLKEVNDPVILERDKTPTTNGLFSYEIFGRLGSDSRKLTFAYIDLKGYYFNPLVYKNLKRLDRKIEECIQGVGNFKIDNNGSLVRDESGETGIDFLYNNWEKLKFKKTDSNDRNERIKMISSLDKNEIFVSKQIVIPPFYRDINLIKAQDGIIGHDEINDMYAKLIRLVSSSLVNDEGILGLSFIGNSTRGAIQNLLLDIYNYFTGYIKGKDGLFRQTVMGKSIDYGARLVISSAHFNKEHYSDMLVSFEYTGVPIAQAVTLFFPFIVKYVQDFFEKNLGTLTKMLDKDGKMVDSSKLMSQFNHEKIKKYIKRFIKSPGERFEPIKAVIGDEMIFFPFKYKVNDGEEQIRRMTWLDLLYIATYDVTRDKHVYVTRYPLEDYMGIYPSKINILTTFKTLDKVTIMGIDSFITNEYKSYPIIDLEMDKQQVGLQFIDSLQVFNGMLKALGGDYDGDMVTIRGVFTQEANKEAEEIMYSPKNILNIMGNNIRLLSHEAIQTIYQLTKE